MVFSNDTKWWLTFNLFFSLFEYFVCVFWMIVLRYFVIVVLIFSIWKFSWKSEMLHKTHCWVTYKNHDLIKHEIKQTHINKVARVSVYRHNRVIKRRFFRRINFATLSVEGMKQYIATHRDGGTVPWSLLFQKNIVRWRWSVRK